MDRYLLFDSGCSLCSGLATDIAAASDGLLAARSLHDPELQAALKRARPEWRWEPTLLEVEGKDVRVFTGFALRAQLLTVLGPRRAWRVAQIVARAQTYLGDMEDASRRAVVMRGATLAAGIVGLTSIGPHQPRVLAQPNPVEASVASRRPGRNSQREGIKSWRVRRTPSGAVVAFEHRKRALSGEATVTYGGGGKTMSLSLMIDRQSYRLSFSGDSIAGTDAQGRTFSASLERTSARRRDWRTSAASKQVARGSRVEYRIGLAIAADLAPSPRGRVAGAAVATGEVTTSQQCTVGLTCCVEGCCKENLLDFGDSPDAGLTRSLACEAATDAVNRACDYSVGCGKCCRLFDDCDCICEPFFGSDLFCACIRFGRGYGTASDGC